MIAAPLLISGILLGIVAMFGAIALYSPRRTPAWPGVLGVIGLVSVIVALFWGSLAEGWFR